jgi:two-component system cell cycle response regulator CtrA
LLSLRKGTTLTKEMFLNHLYGGMDEPELKIIDVFICKLRKKLANASSGKNYIETVWGRGYVLREPSDEEAKISAA